MWCFRSGTQARTGCFLYRKRCRTNGQDQWLLTLYGQKIHVTPQTNSPHEVVFMRSGAEGIP
jgi:hypothetical protein